MWANRLAWGSADYCAHLLTTGSLLMLEKGESEVAEATNQRQQTGSRTKSRSTGLRSVDGFNEAIRWVMLPAMGRPLATTLGTPI